MTGKITAPHEGLDRLTDLMVEDILSTPDADMLNELRECNEDSKAAADRVRSIIGQARNVIAKRRLEAAKAAVAASKRRQADNATTTDPAVARQLLKRLAANDPDVRQKITLAARNEDELSDRDVAGILDDLRELGVIADDDEAP